MELLFKIQCFPSSELWCTVACSTNKFISTRLYCCCTFVVAVVCFHAFFNTKKHHFQAFDLLFILQSLSLDLCDLGSVMNRMVDQSDPRAPLCKSQLLISRNQKSDSVKVCVPYMLIGRFIRRQIHIHLQIKPYIVYSSTDIILLLSLPWLPLLAFTIHCCIYYEVRLDSLRATGLVWHMACRTPTESRHRLILSTSQRVQGIFPLRIHLRDIKTVTAMHPFWGGKVGVSVDFTWLMV